MAKSEQYRAKQHRFALSQIAVGQIAADDRGDIHKCGVSAVNHTRFFIRKQPMLGQIKNQQRPHPVVGKTLPHLGKKQDEKPARMAEKSLIIKT